MQDKKWTLLNNFSREDFNIEYCNLNQNISSQKYKNMQAMATFLERHFEK